MEARQESFTLGGEMIDFRGVLNNFTSDKKSNGFSFLKYGLTSTEKIFILCIIKRIGYFFMYGTHFAQLK